MEIIHVKTSNIKPYNRNTKKHPANQISNIVNSIKEFDFTQPLVIDERNEIIIGHGRLLAAKQARLEVVPCVIVTGWSENKKKACRLADNKTAGKEYDDNLLKSELLDIDLSFNMADFGFDLDDLFKEKPEDYKQSKNLDNFFKADFDTRSNEWGIPETKPFPDDLSGIEWVSFGEKAGIKNPENTGIHFYIDDYKFESVWKTPGKWLELFKQCRAVVTPDFSNYIDMPKAQQLWNHYRRQWCGKYWQEHGVNVVSSLSWANGQIESWSFAGIPQGTICATSFVGDNIDKQESIEELKQVIEIVQPCKIFIKANTKEEAELRKHLDFELIPPYSFRR